MKKLLAILMVVLMAASLVPAAYARDMAADDVSVTYSLNTANAKTAKVGDTFELILSISENSRLFSGHWYIDYPEEYVEPIDVITDWEGSISYQIDELEFQGANTSDIPSFMYRLTYEGGTFGEAGNMYTDIGMYLGSFDYGNGLLLGGELVKIVYRIIKLPTSSAAEHDSGGYFLSFPILVRESTYWVPGTQIAPGVDYFMDHETVNTVPGKLYIKTGASTTYSVAFYGLNNVLITTLYATYGASVTAPAVPQVVNLSTGTYLFYGWDTAFNYVTSNIEVHAQYVLRGDTDLDGTVTANDALLAMRAVMGLDTVNDMQAFAGNVDNEAGLSANDALKIMRYVMHLINTLA